MDWAEATQKRVSTTSLFLTQIKSLKMMGLTAYVSRKLRGLRIQEASESKKFRTYIVWILGVGTCRIAPSNAYLCGPHDMR